jgi:hypothetical protein
LKFQILWNLIIVLIEKNYKNIHLSVCYDFSKFDGSKKSRCDVPNGPPKDVFAYQIGVAYNTIGHLRKISFKT